MRRITATVEAPNMRSETPSTDVGALALLPLPKTLSGLQTRGAACVWCGATLTTPTARDLGARPGPGGVQIFPRGCASCARDRAASVYQIHIAHCVSCLRNAPCADRQGLRLLASEGSS